MKLWQLTALSAVFLFGLTVFFWISAEAAYIEREEQRLEREQNALESLQDLCRYKWPLEGKRYAACLKGEDSRAGR